MVNPQPAAIAGPSSARARSATVLWFVVGAVLPTASSAALVTVRGTVPNTDIALLITGAVLIVATSGRRSAAAVAALSAAVSFDYYHTLPYQSLTIANRNDALATLVLGLLALTIGQVAAQASNSHTELVMLVGAGVLSQAVPEPARFLVDHQGLDVSLAVLVFATALAVPPRAFKGLATNAWRLVITLLSTAVVLPALSWAVSHLVPTLALRRGVLTVGLAPAEIASVATTSLAGGDTAISAGMLVGSALVSIAAAGVALPELGGGATIHWLSLLTNLALIVGAPLAAGIGIRAVLNLSDRHEAAAERVSVAVVTLLVWLVASQVKLSSAYFAVAIALLLFLAGSAILGRLLGVRAPAPVATALLLTTSMRDFAIAAGIAVAAFGTASAAPLGLYGVIVITWGMGIAALRSRRFPAAAAPSGPPAATMSVVAPAVPGPAELAEVGTAPPGRAMSYTVTVAPPPAPRKAPAPTELRASVSTAVEVDVTGIVNLLASSGPSFLGFVARAAVDTLRESPLGGGPPSPKSVTLGVIAQDPSGPTCKVVAGADECRLRALDKALLSAPPRPDDVDSPPSLWLTNSSEHGVSTVMFLPDAVTLSAGAIRREPRIITIDGGDAIAARSVATLTLTYPQAGLDPSAATRFLHAVVSTIQTRDWNIELQTPCSTPGTTPHTTAR